MTQEQLERGIAIKYKIRQTEGLLVYWLRLRDATDDKILSMIYNEHYENALKPLNLFQKQFDEL
jgi:hypothetical protein